MGGKRVSWTPTQLKLNNQQAVLVLAALHSGRGRNLGFFPLLTYGSMHLRTIQALLHKI